jgi:hypothetical protein
MTRPVGLDLPQFEGLLDLHGAKLERWPEEERSRAQALLSVSEPARAALAHAQRLDALLDALPVPEPSRALAARIAALPQRAQVRRARSWPFAAPAIPVFGWAAAAALGLFVGSSGLPELDLFSAQSDAAAVAGSPDPADADADEVDSGDDWNELSELTLGALLAPEDE